MPATSITHTKSAPHLTLVPNKRRLDMHVAETLRRDAAKEVIIAPPVAVFSQWVEDLLVRICLLDGKEAPASVDAGTLIQIWAEILEREMDFLAEGERNLAARQARAADRLLQHWWTGEDTPWLERTFWTARHFVAEKLAARQVLSAEGWLEGLVHRLASDAALPCDLPGSIILDGFHEITRLEQKLFDALAQRGVDVTSAAPAGAAPPAIKRCSFASLEEELAAAAHWAGERLQAGCSRIAVVINGVQGMPEKIRETFDRVIGAEQQLDLDDRVDCVFHIAHGERLSNHPVIQDALALLALSLGGPDCAHEFPAISRWLLSPFWEGADRERFARASLELDLRRIGSYWWTPREVSRKAASHKPCEELSRDRDDGCRILLECINRLDQALLKPSAKQTTQASAAALFCNILHAWGWPGPLALGVDVKRCVKQFSALLEKLDGLPFGSNAEALNLLRPMCAEATLALRGGPLSPIQVLSPEDAAGRRYDAAWMANMHAANWPAQATVNPFLPSRAARCIPRSTAEGELAYCERLTALLGATAPEVLFSWSHQAGDVPNAVSPLLEHLPVIDVARAAPASWYARVAPGTESLRGYLNHPWLRPAADASGLPLRPAVDATPAQAIPGGAGMFRDQSGCPMLAYYRFRLQASFDDMPAPFAAAAFRGSLMHSAMYFLFTAQAEGGQQGEPGRPGDDRIRRAVDQALHRHQARQRLLEVSYQAERQRLVRLLGEWLDLEHSRTGFEVLHLEQRIKDELRGHPLTVQADRIDRLGDGSLMVIDYKSSFSSATGWGRERLRHAQLPLYAVLLSAQAGAALGGIALATVRGGECGLAGIAADPAAKFDRIKSFDDRRSGLAQRFDSWQALFGHWQRCIDGLAGEIVRGECDNAVYDPQCLSYAGLDILLRRAEGEAWCLAHGEGGFAATGENDDQAS